MKASLHGASLEGYVVVQLRSSAPSCARSDGVEAVFETLSADVHRGAVARRRTLSRSPADPGADGARLKTTPRCARLDGPPSSESKSERRTGRMRVRESRRKTRETSWPSYFSSHIDEDVRPGATAMSTPLRAFHAKRCATVKPRALPRSRSLRKFTQNQRIELGCSCRSIRNSAGPQVAVAQRNPTCRNMDLLRWLSDYAFG